MDSGGLQASNEPMMEDLHAYMATESARMVKMFEEPDIEPWTEMEKRSNGSTDLLSVLGGRRSDEADL